MKIIECKDLSKSFRGFNAINKMNFSIEENTITGLIGRNGAGKTTLMKMLCGYLRPNVGEVKVFGETPFNSIRVSSDTIFVDENMSFPKHLTLEEILCTAKSFYPNFNERMGKRLLEYFSLDGRRSHRQLSKGMRSTFNMIIGLSSRCPLTIMDEPTTGMDAAVRKDFYKIILKDYIEWPRTILISSHHLEELEDILEDILLLKEGAACLHMPLIDMKEYAIGLRGKEEAVNPLVKGERVLHREGFGKDSIYLVVETEDFEEDLRAARAAGLDASKVNANDLCIYLTAPGKGGIDYVFDEE